MFNTNFDNNVKAQAEWNKNANDTITNLNSQTQKLILRNFKEITAYYNYDNENFSISLKVNDEWSRILNFSNTGMWLSLKHTTGGASTESVLWTTVH